MPNEPPKPGEKIVVVYRPGESVYTDAGLLTVIPSMAGGTAYDSYVWFLIAGKIHGRSLDEEGISWARAPSDHTWTDVVQSLRAAMQLVGMEYV